MGKHKADEVSRSWDRFANTVELGLWLVLLCILGIVSLEAFRQRTAEVAVPEVVHPDGFVEAEYLPVRGVSYGVRLWTQPTTTFRGSWSSDGHLFAMNAELGSWVEFELPIVEAGLHEVAIFLTRAPDYGVVDVSIDGEAYGSPIDLWQAAEVLPADPIVIGQLELSTQSVLRLEVVGTNDRSSSPHHQFGFDGIQLTRLD
jgi:hypothetical protein